MVDKRYPNRSRRLVHGRHTDHPSSKQPRGRVADRLALVQRENAFDATDQGPDEPPEQDRQSDDNEGEDDPDREIQQPDPEGPDLELVMGPQHRVGIADLDMRDD